MTGLICYLRNPNTMAVTHTLTELLSASGDLCLNAIGRGSFTMPMVDLYLGDAMKVSYGLIAEVNTQAGMPVITFIIKDITTELGSQKTLVASGPTLDYELNYPNVGDATIGNGAGGMANSRDLANLMAYAPGWYLSTEGDRPGTLTGTNLVSAGETVLDMLRQAQEQSGEYFRLFSPSAIRALYWFHSPTNEGHIFTVPYNPALIENDPTKTVLSSITKNVIGGEIVTRIYAYGAGLGDERVRMNAVPAATRTALAAAWPNYNINFDTGRIINTAAETTHPIVDRPLQFGNIKPASTSTADMQTAAIALFNAAIRWMEVRKSPATQYTAEIFPHIYTPLFPGTQVSIEYEDGAHTFFATLIMLETRLRVGADGIPRATCLLADRLTPVLDESMFIARKFSAIDTTLRHTAAIPTTGSAKCNFVPTLTRYARAGSAWTSGAVQTLTPAQMGTPSGAKAVKLGWAVLTTAGGRTRAGYLSSDPTDIDSTGETGWARFAGIANTDANGNVYWRCDGTPNGNNLNIWVSGYWI